jgi:hypothetical protein
MAEVEQFITVSTTEGSNYLVPFLQNMTTKEVKFRTNKIVGGNIDDQMLIFGGRELEPNKTLADSNVSKGSKVFFFLKFFNTFTDFFSIETMTIKLYIKLFFFSSFHFYQNIIKL